ncbi:18821_t:CDS:2 [Dentiscutata erythropus]|uniref:18821_t:CDS:1 n=1 Tax=Dentiscutata erythropus TaxID=1348616 RepID=A0A9N8VP34_9GLOM|nr:18821_t:CDS:2 [Dentiscutata erythropus]
MADPNIRTTPRLKVSLNKPSHDKKLIENETKPPPNVKLEQWKRLQELKRRREEIKNDGNKKKKKQEDREEIEKRLDPKRSDSLSTSDQTISQSSMHRLDQTIPKSLVKYVNMNSHLKGVDHGRLAPKGRLEKELDKAVANGDLDLASKISDQIAQRNYENTIQEAIECKEYDERKKREEELKAKKKKPKLKWGYV